MEYTTHLRSMNAPLAGGLPSAAAFWQVPATTPEEDRLAEAEVRLMQARTEAVLGIRYDADEYDRIVCEYRAAKRYADAARLAARHAVPSIKSGAAPFDRPAVAQSLRMAA